MRWASIDLVCGWLVCLNPGSSPNRRGRLQLLHLLLLMFAQGSLELWPGRLWGLFCGSSVRLKGYGKGLEASIVVRALVREPLTLLHNYVPTQTPPPPLGSDPSGAGCCVKRRDCVLYCEQGLLLPYTAHLTPHIQTRTMPAWEGSRGSCVRGGMLLKEGGKLLCRGPAVKDRSSHSKLKMTPSDSHVNRLFSCAPIIADVKGEETPYGFLALLRLLLEDRFGSPKWRRHFVFIDTLKHPV